MDESRIDQNDPAVTPLQPRTRSTGAIILFLLLALLTPVCLLVYHLILWTLEQQAIASASTAQLAWAGLIGLAVQGVILSVVFTILWRFTTDLHFKPVYAGWLVAVLMAFPGLLLRLLGPNNDQLGSILQIVICTVTALIVMRVRGTRIDWRSDNISFAFLLAAFGVAPFALFGAFGALTDAILSLLAGLAFGWLAALLMESTTGNRLLDAFGIGAVLALLGSAIGYDGAQLILIAILPSFAFAISAVMPSRAAAAILTGLLTAAGLIFFDPTELTVVLGDETGIAVKAVSFAIGLGLAVGLIALIIRYLVSKGPATTVTRVLGVVGASAAWVVIILLFLSSGHHGFYGDRLFVIMKDQADLSSVRQIQDIKQRRMAAYQMLTKKANETQAELRKTFDTFDVKYTPYYLVNAMEVRGGTLVRLYLLTRPEVDRVIPSPRLRPGGPEPSLPPSGGNSPPPGVQWNVSMIGADKVWNEFGVRGKGVVIGQSDSGVDVNHPELHDSYRGNTEGNDYNWFDPWNHKPAPYDEGGHGTHTLGIILGKDGIGIAPDATWFACANLTRNLGNPALYLDCMQFMLAPFPQNGNPFTDGDPTRAADVLNNSWGCPELEGCDPNALLAGANHLRDAGIFVAVSAGNDGPNCSTINAPLSLYDSVFSVGAIDRSGNVAFFSSRGPVTADGSGRIKPDIVAPGVDVLSSVPGGGYAAESGTSMAGPHVAGAVALLWSADPTLIGNIDRTEQLLIQSADPYTGNRNGCFEGDVPNDAYGYGVLDVYQAVKMALGK
jgi:subtilisin family serine protease